jgi:hypothetical protein
MAGAGLEEGERLVSEDGDLRKTDPADDDPIRPASTSTSSTPSSV